MLGYTTAIAALIGLGKSAISQPDTALGHSYRIASGVLWLFVAGGTSGAIIGRSFGCSTRGFWIGIGVIYVICVVTYAGLQ